MLLLIDLRAGNVTIDVEDITILLSCFNPNTLANETETNSFSCEPVVPDVFVIMAFDNGKIRKKEVVINRRPLLTQIDPGSDALIIPNNFWKKMGRQKLCKFRLN